MSRDRNERHYSDKRIVTLIMEQAARDCGTSPVLMKDSLYSYADRARVQALIQQLVAEGRLLSSCFPGGMGKGRGSIRYFTQRAHADAFAAGLAPIRPGVERRKPKPSAAAAVASTAPKFPQLHDKRDRMGRPGVMPNNIAAALRKPGSNARPFPPPVKPEATEARITDRTRVTVAPVCHDQRFTVQALPPGYRSQLDPRDCRPWAQAAVQGSAA